MCVCVCVCVVLTHDGHGVGRVWNLLGDDDEEEREGDEDGDAERHLLSALRRQQEDHEQHEGEHDARQQDVHEVERVLPLKHNLYLLSTKYRTPLFSSLDRWVVVSCSILFRLGCFTVQSEEKAFMNTSVPCRTDPPGDAL